ncbi:MAG TPA: helix-turn-helix transcriptional regulator [Anaeromyxobacter sp.]|nr:helix-turn-helix transcriptional regulator [Anaeromyxobacter sp.]
MAAFSTWLARERELRGLSRDEVERATRLAPAVIQALEAGDPSRLPARAYMVGYLRAYGAAVGLDPDEVVLRFEEAVGAEERSSPSRWRARPRTLAWAATALVAIGSVMWLWLRGR